MSSWSSSPFNRFDSFREAASSGITSYSASHASIPSEIDNTMSHTGQPNIGIPPNISHDESFSQAFAHDAPPVTFETPLSPLPSLDHNVPLPHRHASMQECQLAMMMILGNLNMANKLFSQVRDSGYMDDSMLTRFNISLANIEEYIHSHMIKQMFSALNTTPSHAFPVAINAQRAPNANQHPQSSFPWRSFSAAHDNTARPPMSPLIPVQPQFPPMVPSPQVPLPTPASQYPQESFDDHTGGWQTYGRSPSIQGDHDYSN